MADKVSIRPAEMSISQAVSLCHMLDYVGRQNFLGILTEDERKIVERNLYQEKDEIIYKRCDGTESNGTVICYNRNGYYKIAYEFEGRVVLNNTAHHTRIRLGSLKTE